YPRPLHLALFSPHQPGRGGVVTINCPVTVGRGLNRYGSCVRGWVRGSNVPLENPLQAFPAPRGGFRLVFITNSGAESVSGHHQLPKNGGRWSPDISARLWRCGRFFEKIGLAGGYSPLLPNSLLSMSAMTPDLGGSACGLAGRAWRIWL